MKKPILIGLAAILLAGVAGWSSGWTATVGIDAAVADRLGELGRLVGLTPGATGLVIYGNVDIRQVSLAFRVGGRVAELLAEEGDAVRAGAPLARLDRTPYTIAVRQAEAALANAQAAADKLHAGSRPEEIASARATLAEQRASLANAELAYARAEPLGRQGTVSQATVDDAVAARDRARAGVDAATAALSLAVAGPRAEDIAAGDAGVASARATLDSARLSVADTELVAPADGVVLSRVVEPGAMVASGGSVLVLSLDRPVVVRAYVGEPDLGRVHPGQTVRVTADGMSGSGYDATVGFVSPVAEFTPKSVETPDLRTDLVYRLRIIVDHPGPDLRQGMPVTVHVGGGG